MKNILLLFFLTLINLIYSLENSLSMFNIFGSLKTEMNELLKPLIQSFISTNITLIDNLSLTEKCYSKLNNTYFLTKNVTSRRWIMQRNIRKTLYYYTKLFFTSSKNKYDLGFPEQCENIKDKDYKYLELKEKFKYFSVLIENTNSHYEELISNNNEGNNFFGLCVVEGCENQDYIKIINNIINNININIDKNKTYINNNRKISIFSLKNENNEKKTYIKILKYIPLFLILIHILFVIVNIIPIYLYKLIVHIFCCGCKKKKTKGNIKIKRILSKDDDVLLPRDTNDSINTLVSSTISLNTNIDKVNEMLSLLYNIDKNYEVLMEYNKQNDNINNSGLSYVNGLKGISMIFFLFGNVFIAIYNSPLIEPDINNFYYILKNVFYFIFNFGIKYSPKLLICCSGFTLFYKFICFLDDKIELEKEIIKQKEEKKAKSEKSNNSYADDDNYSNKSNKSNQSKSGTILFNFNSLVSVKYLGIFIGYQLHIYILYILLMTFFLFSFYEAISFLHGPGPVWDFFNQKMIEPGYKIGKIIMLLFGFQGFLIPYFRNDKYNILNYFNIVYQEIFYFIISSIFLFFGYKKNLKIDLFCGIFMIVLFLSRIIFFFIFGFNDKDYFNYESYGLFFASLFYNYIYYLLGIYFGMLNYVIQKRYTILDCKKNKKKYLIHCITVIEILKKRKQFPIFIIIIIILFFLLIIFLQPILIFLFELTNNSIKESMISYDNNFFVNILFFIDTDIIILGINIMAILMYLNGNIIITAFFNHNFWSVFNRFYFSYILCINPIILYVIYIRETKIKFNMINCFLYTFISGIIIYTIVSFVYIVFELPFKKAIRYWFKLSDKKISDERFNNIENNFNDYQLTNQGEANDDNISNDEEYNEDDDEEDDEDMD